MNPVPDGEKVLEVAFSALTLVSLKGGAKNGSFLAASSKAPLLTITQAKRIKTINEIAHNWKVRKTLSGEILDEGHILKIKEGMTGLKKSKHALENSLQNPKLNAATRGTIQQSIDKASGLINKADNLLKDIQ